MCACLIAAGAIFASLFTDFNAPPPAVRPWCYWYWVNGNVDEETMTADLAAMKRVGFGGLLLLDPRGYDKSVWKPEPKMDYASPEWGRAVGFAARECARLGLELTISFSAGGGSFRGSCLTGEDGPKRLVCGVNVDEVPSDYEHYHDICRQEVWVAGDAAVKAGWRNAGGVTGRWERDADSEDVTTVPAGTPGAKKVSLRFGYCLIPKREHDVDVIDPAAVERHFNRFVDLLTREMGGDLVGKTWTHVYSCSWEGAIPTWTATFEEQFSRYTSYEIRHSLPELAGFVPAQGRRVLQDYRRVRNLMFKDDFYGTIRRLAHIRGLKMYSESGGPWNRDPSVFRDADQLAFLGVNDMPQGENWTVSPHHHAHAYHNRPAANAAHIYGLKRASAETFTHMDYHYSMWPEKLKRVADETFVDGINHLVWHTFTCSPKEFGVPGIEYFAGTHINRNVTWFPQAHAFVLYLARCQLMLQSGEPVTDIAIYAGSSPYQHWGRYRERPWDDATLAIPRGYNYDLLNDETLEKRKGMYSTFVDATKPGATFENLPEPDFEGDFNEVIHRRTADGTDIYFVITCGTGHGWETFRVRGRTAELWDPIGGTRRLAPKVATAPDGRVKVYMDFERGGSVFVVFRSKEASAADPAPDSDWPTVHGRMDLTGGPWKIEIGGRPYARLGDWTKADDPDIRFFSGTASYRTAFELADKPTDRTLLLGRVAGGLAEVFVNGMNCGVAWCFPYRVRVPATALRSGRNELEVKVVNTWRNRLIGDCLLPSEKRHTRGCLQYNPGPHNGEDGRWWFRMLTTGYSANDELDSCGLYGPVVLR